MLLRLDPERPFGESRADDLRSFSKAQRGNGIIDAARHGLVRVRIDDADARALPVQIAASVLASNTCNLDGRMASRSVSCSFTFVVGSTLATIMPSPTRVSRMISLPSCSST